MPRAQPESALVVGERGLSTDSACHADLSTNEYREVTPPKRGYRQNPHGRSPPCPNCEKQAYLASWGRTARKSPQHQNHKSLEFRRFQITQEKRDAMKHTHFRPQPRDTGISCQLRPGRKPTIPTPKSQIVGIPPFSNHTRKTERDETYPLRAPTAKYRHISRLCTKGGRCAHPKRPTPGPTNPADTHGTRSRPRKAAGTPGNIASRIRLAGKLLAHRHHRRTEEYAHGRVRDAPHPPTGTTLASTEFPTGARHPDASEWHTRTHSGP